MDVDVVTYFKRWLEQDGYPFWSFWENIKSWWELRQHPQVMLMHFNKLKANPKREIKKIAEFVGMGSGGFDEKRIDRIVEMTSFEEMKKRATKIMPGRDDFWKEGAKGFLHKGVNGRWKDVLPKELSEQYEKMAIEKLGPACAHWLKTGDFLKE